MQPPPRDSPLGVYTQAACAADAPKAARVAVEILRKGGHAVDAAIAAAISVGVHNFHSTGIGGGFFATIWDQTEQKIYALDARETAPPFATEEFYKAQKATLDYGPFSIALPGEVAGYAEMHRKFGKLSWEQLFEGAADDCEAGVEIRATNYMPDGIAEMEVVFRTRPQDATALEPMKQLLTNPKTGSTVKPGDFVKFPVLAQTLRRLAKEGPGSFYKGSLAQDIIADLKEVGSPISADDLASYRVEWRQATETKLSGDRFQLFSTPPPGSGPIMALILNVLEGFNLTKESLNDPITWHRVVETFKFAYGFRMELGDEKFVDGIEPLLQTITSPKLADEIRSKISDMKTQPHESYFPKAGVTHIIDRGTAQISIIDAHGNAVSLTSTINSLFGSGIIGRRTGIIFNNEMDDFSSSQPSAANVYGLPTCPANFMAPGKRPMSSMCPSILLEQDPIDSTKRRVKIVVGASGGSRITTATAWATARMLWLGEDPKTAVDAPRLHHQLLPNRMMFEKRFDPQLLNDLAKLGHQETEEIDPAAKVQAVFVQSPGRILANADYRKGGACDGY